MNPTRHWFLLFTTFTLGCSSTTTTTPPPAASPPVAEGAQHTPAASPPIPAQTSKAEAKPQVPVRPKYPLQKSGRVEGTSIARGQQPLPVLEATPGTATSTTQSVPRSATGEQVRCSAIKVHGLPPTTLISCRNPYQLPKKFHITKISAEGMSGVPTMEELRAGYILQPGEARVVITLKEISPPSRVTFVAKTF